MARLNSLATGLGKLSLGISIVVAIVIGVGLGLWLRDITGLGWTLYVGLFLGVGAAVLNVYKAYLQAKNELDELKDRYKFDKSSKADDDDEREERV